MLYCINLIYNVITKITQNLTLIQPIESQKTIKAGQRLISLADFYFIVKDYKLKEII